MNQQNPPALPFLLPTPRRAARRVTDADVARLPVEANFEVDGVDMGAFDPAPVFTLPLVLKIAKVKYQRMVMAR